MKPFSPLRKYEPYFWVPDNRRMSDAEFGAMSVRSFFAFYDAKCATVWSGHSSDPMDDVKRASETLAAGVVFG